MECCDTMVISQATCSLLWTFVWSAVCGIPTAVYVPCCSPCRKDGEWSQSSQENIFQITQTCEKLWKDSVLLLKLCDPWQILGWLNLRMHLRQLFSFNTSSTKGCFVTLADLLCLVSFSSCHLIFLWRPSNSCFLHIFFQWRFIKKNIYASNYYCANVFCPINLKNETQIILKNPKSFYSLSIRLQSETLWVLAHLMHKSSCVTLAS